MKLYLPLYNLQVVVFVHFFRRFNFYSMREKANKILRKRQTRKNGGKIVITRLLLSFTFHINAVLNLSIILVSLEISDLNKEKNSPISMAVYVS